MFDLPDGLLLQQLPLKYLGTVAAAPINHIIELMMIASAILLTGWATDVSFGCR